MKESNAKISALRLLGRTIVLYDTKEQVLRGGEYTVLAATGATPRLLVVRVTPQE